MYIDFNYANVNPAGFDLYLNEAFYGFYQYEDLPMEIPGFAAGDGEPVLIQVNNNDDPACFALADYTAPLCTANECSIDEVIVEAYACEGGQFYVDIVVQESNPEAAQFSVAGNGNEYGNFSYEETFITLGPFDGDGETIYEFVVRDLENPECSNFGGIGPIACEEESCNIWDLVVDPNVCDDDGNYELYINFNYENVNPAGFDLFLNESFYGFYQYDDLPMEVTGFAAGDGEPVLIHVINNDDETCLAVADYIAPLCENTDCVINNVIAEAHPCENGQFYVDIEVQASNPAAAQFSVVGNGNEYGVFPYAETFITLGPFEGDGETIYEFIVRDLENPDCSNFGGIGPIACDSGACAIGQLVIDGNECSENGNYSFVLNFEHENQLSGTFLVYIDGELDGPYAYENLPVIVDGIAGEGQTISLFVQDFESEFCSNEINVEIPNCSIPDCAIGTLVPQVVECGNGNFYFQVDFAFANTSDTFSLLGNGNDYGDFEYASLPILVGPLEANTGLNYELVVIDNEFNDCAEDIGIGEVSCEEPICGLYDLSLIAGECNDDFGFDIILNFEYVNSSEGFQVTNGAGTNYGTFAYADLPLVFENFEGNGNSYAFEIVDLENETCFTFGQVFAPNCFESACEIIEPVVEFGDCDDDLFYEVFINFAHQNVPNDFFEIFYDGEYVGFYPLAELPLNISHFAPADGALHAMTIQVNDFPDCFKEFEFEVPFCEPAEECSIDGMIVEAYECEGQSFMVDMDFSVSNPASNSFQVWVNDDIYETYSYEDLFVTLGPFEANGQQYNFSVFDSEMEACFGFYELIAPDCIEPQECSFSNMIVEAHPCEDGSFMIDLNFAYENPQSDSFDLYVNGEYFTTDLYENLWASYGPFEGNQAYQFIVADAEDFGCAVGFQLDLVECVLACELWDLEAAVTDCNEEGFYGVELNFNHENFATESFDVFDGSTLIGTFPLSSLPIYIENFAEGNGGSISLVVTEHDNESCYELLLLSAPNCETSSCVISDVQATVISCESEEFFVSIDFAAQNGSEEGFAIFGNGNNYGNFSYEEVPVTLGPLPAGTLPYEFGVADLVTDLCGSFVELGPVNCDEEPCGIMQVIADPGNCDDLGNFNIVLALEFTGSPDAEFLLETNTGIELNFTLDDLPLPLGGFAGDGDSVYEIIVSTGTNCSDFAVVEAMNCITETCEIGSPSYETECNTDGTYNFTIDFAVANPVSPAFGVENNYGFIAYYSYDILPVTIFNLEAQALGYEWHIFDSELTGCDRELFMQAPECEIANCQINDPSVAVVECEAGEFFVQLSFEYSGLPPNSNGFTVQGNGTNYGLFAYNNLPAEIGPLAADNETIYEFSIIDLGNPDCTNWTSIDPVSCSEFQCNIEAEVASYECINEEYYTAVVTVAAENSSGVYDLWLDGEFVLSFDGNQVQIEELTNGTHSFTIYDGEDDGCVYEGELSYSCPDNCELDITLIEYFENCDGDDFFVDVVFNHNGVGSELQVLIDGELAEQYAYGEQSYVTVGPLAGDGDSVYEITLQDAEFPDCGATVEVEALLCVTPCVLSDLSLSAACEEDGTVSIALNMEYQGAEGLFGVEGSGGFLGYFAYEDLPVLVTGIPGDGSVYNLTAFDESSIGCSVFGELVLPECEQPICNIFEVSTTTNDCIEGEYTVMLDFAYEFIPENSNGFWVQGNGQIYGLFNYEQLPIELGPFTGDGETALEFSISDLADPECIGTVELEPVTCTVAPCAIDITEVNTLPCDNGQWSFEIAYEEVNPAADFLVLSVNGALYENYEYGSGILTAGPFEGDGETVYIFELVDAENSACSAITEVIAPICEEVDCTIGLMEIQQVCNENFSFNLFVDFEYANTSDSFELFIDEQSDGIYEYSALPIVVEGIEDLIGNYFIEVVDLENPDCSYQLETIAPNCEQPCDIAQIQYETDCNNDGTFDMYFLFEYENPASDFFVLSNQDGLVGEYAYAELPVLVTNLPASGGYAFIAADAEAGDCISSVEFAAPDCPIPCTMSELILQPSECADGSFYVNLIFAADNASDSFTVVGNGNEYGTFAYDQVPLELGPFDGDNETVYEFVVTDSEFDYCSTFNFVDPIDCSASLCEIGSLNVDLGECENGNFTAQLDFEHSNTTGGFFLYINGDLYNDYAYASLPINIENLLGDESVYLFTVVDAQGEVCSASTEFFSPNCQSLCEMGELSLSVAPDWDNCTFQVLVNFEHAETADLFNVLINGEFYASFNYDQLPVMLGDFELNEEAYEFEIVDELDGACTSSGVFQSPECTPVECLIGEIDYEVLECNEFELLISLDFDVVDTGGDAYVLYLDNTPLGPLSYNDLPLEFEIPDNTEMSLTIQSLSDAECNNTIIIYPYVCGGLVWPGDANSDGIANNFDLLNLGIAMGQSGFSRVNPTIDWEGQECVDWTLDFLGGANFKHADCNGDGTVALDDTLALSQNYAQTHGKTGDEQETENEEDPPLYVDLPDDVLLGGSEVVAPIVFGEEDFPAVNVYGIAFTLHYDGIAITPETAMIKFENSWLGELGVDMVTIVKHFPDLNDPTFEIALVRTDQENRSGFGPVGALEFILIENVEGKHQDFVYDYTCTISDVRILSFDQSPVPYRLPTDFGTVVGNEYVEPPTPISLYPNPVSDYLTVSGVNPYLATDIQLYNAAGQLVKLDRQPGAQLQIHMRELPPGVYWLELTNDEMHIGRRILISGY